MTRKTSKRQSGSAYLKKKSVRRLKKSNKNKSKDRAYSEKRRKISAKISRILKMKSQQKKMSRNLKMKHLKKNTFRHMTMKGGQVDIDISQVFYTMRILTNGYFFPPDYEPLMYHFQEEFLTNKSASIRSFVNAALSIEKGKVEDGHKPCTCRANILFSKILAFSYDIVKNTNKYNEIFCKDIHEFDYYSVQLNKYKESKANNKALIGLLKKVVDGLKDVNNNNK